MTTPSVNTIDPEYADSADQTEADTVIYLQSEGSFEDEFPGTSVVIAGAGFVGLWGWAGQRRG